MKAIIGLGNPGKDYRNTRHNIGFRVVEEIAKRHALEKQECKNDALVGHIRIDKQKVLLVKPLTYMNLSGKAVKALKNWYKIGLENLIVIYDDMDLDLGCLRIRAHGGTGGHKGMVSICESLRSQEFPRVRIGIGRAPIARIQWVLGEFTQEEDMVIETAVKKAADAIECWVKKDISTAMNFYN